MENPSFKDEIETRLANLPILASVAFAARAARRVAPLYAHHSAAEAGNIELLSKAVSIAEKMAAGEKIDFDTASGSARAVAGAARAVDEAAAHSARAAAGAAGAGAIAAGGRPESETHAARAAANSARDADRAADDETCRAAMRQDLDLLSKCQEENSDGPASLLARPLWPAGEPAWFSKKPTDNTGTTEA